MCTRHILTALLLLIILVTNFHRISEILMREKVVKIVFLNKIMQITDSYFDNKKKKKETIV
jgi:hypothetical protein